MAVLLSPKPKVLHYYSLSSHIGGPLVYIRNLLNSRLSNLYEFETCFQEMAPKGVNLPLLLRMRDQIKSSNPDILHVHGLQSEGLYGLLAGRLAGCKKILVTVHGLASDTVQMDPVKRILYKHIVEPFTLRQVDSVYCVSEHAANRSIIKKNARRLLPTIHTGIGLQKSLRSRHEVRNEWGIPDDRIIGIITGRIVKDKGYDELSQVIRYFFKHKEDRLRFCIVGDGEYAEELRHTLREEISARYAFLCGRRDDVYDLLNASDFFIFPSWHENLSIALLEASQAGLPCIATNVGGNPEIIIEGMTGILVPPNDADALIQGVKCLLENPDQMTRMKAAAKTRIAKDFSLHTMIQSIDAVYREMLVNDNQPLAVYEN
jgi:L-malate glycosyltransferase